MITVLKGNDFDIEWTINTPEGGQVNLDSIECSIFVRSRINGAFELPTFFKRVGVLIGTVPGCMLPTGKYFLDLVCKKTVGDTTKCRRTRTKEVIVITENIDDVSGDDNLVVTSKMNDFNG